MVKLGEYIRIAPNVREITQKAYLLKDNTLKIGFTKCWDYFPEGTYHFDFKQQHIYAQELIYTKYGLQTQRDVVYKKINAIKV